MPGLIERWGFFERRAHQFPSRRDLVQRLVLEQLIGDDPLQLRVLSRSSCFSRLAS
jgi:hypothetical protein